MFIGAPYQSWRDHAPHGDLADMQIKISIVIIADGAGAE